MSYLPFKVTVNIQHLSSCQFGPFQTLAQCLLCRRPSTKLWRINELTVWWLFKWIHMSELWSVGQMTFICDPHIMHTGSAMVCNLSFQRPECLILGIREHVYRHGHLQHHPSTNLSWLRLYIFPNREAIISFIYTVFSRILRTMINTIADLRSMSLHLHGINFTLSKSNTLRQLRIN